MRAAIRGSTVLELFMFHRGVVFFLAIFALAPPAAAEIKGDKKAIALVDKMIDRLGGAEVWSEARTLYLEYEGWRSNPAQPIDERAWRDLQEPNQKVVFEGRLSDVTFNMIAETSWLQHSERGTRIFTEEQHANNLAFWEYDFYTIIHKLARGDQRISVKLDEPQTVRISGPSGADWGWFEIDMTGQPVRWGAPDGDDRYEYLYGPVRAYGNINFPAWGTAVDGFWRFEYKTVDVSRTPLDVDLTAPPDAP